MGLVLRTRVTPPGHMYQMWQKCGPFGEGPTTATNTCAPRSQGENILGLKKGHDTLYTAFGERMSQNTHRGLI